MDNKTDVGKLQKGDILSFTQYMTVTSSNAGSSMIAVVNEDGLAFNISNSIVEKAIYSPSQCTSEVKVTQTELVALLSNVGDTVFEAGFYKQPDAKVINEVIASSNKGKIKAVADMQKDINTAFKGEFRVIQGYLIAVETGLGRSRVIALNLPPEEAAKNKIRQIDHRTISYLIYKQVKYILK